jgi:transposase InsO family protein
MVPQHLIPYILREAHGQFLAGHFGVSKTKERLLQSYYWSNMEKDISEHLQRCDRCQITRKNVASPELLSPLPQCTEPNQRVHADLFGPLKNADGDRKFILCITDAFTKYVELVVLPNKEALTVATAILNRWICRHGLPLEFLTDQGKEFTNKMAQHLFEALDVHHSTTASYHPQCNSQAEVCNKTIAQYLSTFVDEGTTNWELFVPALAFAYNTSYHRSVKATPYSLTFGMEARLPAFFASDFNRLHNGSEAGTHLERLLRARELAVENNLEATAQQKSHYDATATHHVYHEGQFVLLEDFNFLNKNRKLAPKFSGPFRILRVKGDHNVELLLTNGRKIVVNVARVKPYLSSTASFNDAPASVGDTPTATPPPLTLAHSRRPGRPRKFSSPQGNVDNKKVLSPAPSVSFSNLGADSPVGGPPVQTETSVTRTHPMRTRSAVTQDALSARLNVILSRTFHCVLDNPRKVPQKVSPRKLRIRRPLQMGTPYGDPYKYSEYPETAHYIDPPQPGIFNDVVGDGYFDDDEDDEQGFRFEDLIPVLEDDSDDYDPEADYNRYADEAGYRDEGEADPPVPPQPPRPGEEIQPPVLRLTPPADQRRRITTPRRPLPDEGGEEDGAAGGEAWQTPASIDAQREFYSALLDEVDNYTRAAENTQRTLRSLGSAQQQERIKAEIRKRAQELQEQLEWADKNLDQRAISDAKLERAFRPAPAPPPRDGRGSRRRPPDPGSPDSSPPRPVTRSQKK